MLAVSRALSKNDLEFYIKWLEYIPKHWEINRILDKKVKNLTPYELEKLMKINHYKEDSSFLKSFIDKINSKCKNKNGRIVLNISLEDNQKLSEIIKKFDTEQIIQSKLSEEELQIINNSAIDELDDKLDNPIVIEYGKILLKNNDSSELVEENNVKKLKKVIG